MMRRTCFVLCLVAMAARAATAQSSAGNIVTGEAKVEIISSYSGSATLARAFPVMM
jgi:hypothetical protein